MKPIRYKFTIAAGFFALMFFIGWVESAGSLEKIPTPQFLVQRGMPQPTDPVALADAFLWLPYRVDGALDDRGRFTVFENPDTLYKKPGLNCSGLVLSLSRYILGRNLTIDEAVRDRLGDSGPDSDLGRQWDFGWDLILNITEGYTRRVILPDGQEHSLEETTGETLRGFDLGDQQAWQMVFDHMRPGYLYLASFSKPNPKKKGHFLHYHAALLLVDRQGGIWLYQTTRTRRHAYRIRLNSPKGMHFIKKTFCPARCRERKVLILETEIPGRPNEDQVQTKADTPAGARAP